MRVLVTGGAGFIGGHVLEALVDAGHSPCVLDNLSHGKREHVPAGVPLVVADVGDRQAVHRALEEHRPEAIVHLAAQKSVTASVADPIGDAKDNILGSLVVLEAAKEAGVRRFVFASTGGALYGETEQIPTPEEHPAFPEAPYGIAKLSVEHYLRFYSQIHGFQTAVLRLGNVYGPRQDPLGEAGVVAIFCGKILRGEPCWVFGDGRQTRDYVYVKDVAQAVLKALAASGALVLNIGTAREASVLDLLSGLESACGKPVAREFHPARPGELSRSCLAVNKSASALGWEATWRLEDGLAATFRAFEAAE